MRIGGAAMNSPWFGNITVGKVKYVAPFADFVESSLIRELN